MRMRVPRVPRASRARAVGGLAPRLAILDRGVSCDAVMLGGEV